MNVVHRCYVRIGDGEYGNDKMTELAKRVFLRFPKEQYPNLIVTVNEHGGWWLSYLRDGTIVGTANDLATLSERARAFGERVKDYGTEYLYYEPEGEKCAAPSS